MNVLPHIGSFSDNGYCSEENKLVNETRKIMHEPDIAISATTVRVPVENAHSEAVHIELSRPMSAADVRDLLTEAPGICVMDAPRQAEYPLPLDASAVTKCSSAGFGTICHIRTASRCGSSRTISAKGRRSTPCRWPSI